MRVEIVIVISDTSNNTINNNSNNNDNDNDNDTNTTNNSSINHIIIVSRQAAAPPAVAGPRGAPRALPGGEVNISPCLSLSL